MVSAFCGSVASAGGVPTAVLEEVVVLGRLDQLHGAPLSASQGVVGPGQLDMRPVLRAGELLEVVPGLIVTQHSGDGKANQYFLRGFNLDHGTDLATSVDGVPINMPTHGHGQGYTDINFVIPELVQSIQYSKGPYYAEAGNFSAAGAVDIEYRRTLEAPLVILEAGEDSYARGLMAAAPQLGGGALLMALDYAHIDGPWLLEENYRKRNGLLRYSRETERGLFGVTVQGYEGDWRSTDQIPLRAVQAGLVDRFGTVDPTDGGSSHRYSLSAEWSGSLGPGRSSLLLYAVDYDLDLVSNFSYFTDPENGDQFQQIDQRRIYGSSWSWSTSTDWLGRQQELSTGVQLRHDDIKKVGLHRTIARQRFQTIREDAVQQTSYAVYGSVATSWNDRVRTTLGLRADRFEFDVNAGLTANAGRKSDSIISPKFTLVLGPWGNTEFFFNAGKGFHSNDARGTTINVDPTDGLTPVGQVDALVDAMGFDIGMRTALASNAQITVSLWTLKLDSELVFIGDAGTTEASRASKRRGIEASVIWSPVSWLILDADLAWSRAALGGFDPAGDRIPGAVENVASLGLAIDHPSGWFGGARFRRFGEAALIEDNSVRSKPTTIVNIEAGYRFSNRYKISTAVYNVFGSDDNDITYFYESQLPGESQPVADVHFHPVEPRTMRVTLTASF
ncbi:MAG TPA: TonB-dependent receptor [Steroidobacter sp.]|uniref:TonB-dependent receptor n=1 Tax=Steroidobacter sp. TaxID=1978227 RepID=UPI002EDA6A9A